MLKMKLSGNQLYSKLVDDYKIIGEKGVINFSLTPNPAGIT